MITWIISIISLLGISGLGIYTWVLKNKLSELDKNSAAIAQDDARVVAAENIIDKRQKVEAINDKKHVEDTSSIDLLNELHKTSTSRPSSSTM